MGDGAFVAGGSDLTYQVRFENDAAAQAPAQQVVITDTLDANLNLSTFQLNEIAFANQTIKIPPGLDQFETSASLTANGVAIQVNVAATLDRDSRQLKLTLTALDPSTGWLPEDPLVGLLYPNDATHRGEGSFSYSVAPIAGLASGTVIRNRASIVFDYNDPIATPLVSNTLDMAGPSSSVSGLPPITTTDRFTINWSGQDETGGSGVAGYDLYVSLDGGPFTLFLADTQETSMNALGEPGHTYAFYSIARDNVGHVEAAPTGPDTITHVNAAPVAQDDTATAHGAVPVLVAVIDNDSDADHDPLTVTGITQPSHGTATNNGDGTVTYTAAAGFAGEDSFTYTVSDGHSGTATATVRVTVLPVNQPPTFDPIIDQAIDEDAGPQAITITGVSPGPGEAGQAVTLTVTSSNPALVPNPVLTGTGANRTLTYTPAANASGTVTITVTATDDGGMAGGGVDTFRRTFDVVVHPVNDAPGVVNPIADLAARENAPPVLHYADLTQVFHDLDDPDSALAYTVTANTPAGVVSAVIQADDTLDLSFVPNTRGVVDVTVRATDPGGLFAEDTFRVTVNPALYLVDSLLDNDDGNYGPGNLTLREAIGLANRTPGAEAVRFAAALAGQTIRLGDTQLPVLTDDLTIEGPNTGNVRLDAHGVSRVFELAAGKNVTLRRLSLVGGNAADGGAILTRAAGLVLEDSLLSGNHAAAEGGAIDIDGGAVTVRRTSFLDNLAGHSGGAIDNNDGGSHTSVLNLLDCTFASNRAWGPDTLDSGGGGAVYNLGRLNVSNSTFSGNSTRVNGGAIANEGVAVLRNSTLALNRGKSAGIGRGQGGGLWTANGAGASVTLFNTIVAGNVEGAGAGVPSDVAFGSLAPASRNNLIGDAVSSGGLVHGVGGNLVGNNGSGTADLTAILDPVLANQGGPNLVHALRPGSPAVNAGLQSEAKDALGNPLTADARGAARPVNVLFDIGAVEAPSSGAVTQDDLFVLGSFNSPSTATRAVLSNDRDPQGKALAARRVRPPALGNVSLNGDGVFTYTPGPNFWGVDTFTYVASNGATDGNEATVTVLTHNALLVRKLYNQVLGRNPEPRGWENWTRRLNAGTATLGAVASGIFESQERLDPLIAQFYRNYLGREPDANGLANWRRVWQRDGGPDNVLAGILSSPEFYQNAGGTHRGFVTELYRKYLNREPDPTGLNNWVTRLDRGILDRRGVVLGFVTSEENFRNSVRGWYLQYLSRRVQKAEEDSLVAELRHGLTPRSAQIRIIDSPEYRNNPPAPSPGTANRV